MSETTMEWLDWRDREGTPVKQGDWITNKDGRNLEVKGQTPGRMLSLEANDGKFMPKWLFNWDKVRECLRNPILSPSNARNGATPNDH